MTEYTSLFVFVVKLFTLLALFATMWLHHKGDDWKYTAFVTLYLATVANWVEP